MNQSNHSDKNFNSKDGTISVQPTNKILFSISMACLLIVGIVAVIASARLVGMSDEKYVALKNGNKTSSQFLNQQLAKQSKMKKFKDLNELTEYLKDNQLSQQASYRYDRVRFKSSDSMGSRSIGVDSVGPMGFEAGEETGLGSPPSDGDDYSRTNIQVAGVDEADVVKTDGDYIYTLANNKLWILKARPSQESEVVANLDFKNKTASGLYVSGNKLIVYGNTYQPFTISKPSSRRHHYNNNYYTVVEVFDITDRKNPKKIKDFQFEGSYFNSRLIKDHLYFITNKYTYSISDYERVLPMVIEDGNTLSNDQTSPRCNCPDVYYFDVPYRSYNFTSISMLDLKNITNPVKNEVYLLDSGQNMYVSENNIYIVYTKYFNEHDLTFNILKEVVYPLLPAKDRERVIYIEGIDKLVLSNEEKLSKIENIIEKYVEELSKEEQDKLEETIKEKTKIVYVDISKELEKSIIHKINIKEGQLKYQTVGEVTGHVLNQFSMDEDKGYFRIATTKNQSWSFSRFDDDAKPTESYNNLYVLDENLKVVGKVEGLAKGERIYSVRFMQNRAYMVTFKQVDPLFAIDLKDPKNPTVLGQLKIPGYSNYLHPYDDNYLIGFGRETKENEHGGVMNAALKLSLFDVRDVNNLKEIDKYEIGDAYTSSEALNNHKAFLFSKPKNLLVIPVTFTRFIADNLPRFGGNEELADISPIYSAMVFNVDTSGFKLKGKVVHTLPKNIKSDPGFNQDMYYTRPTQINRSLYIDNNLYTLSNQYVQINKLSDLELVKIIELMLKDQDTKSVQN